MKKLILLCLLFITSQPVFSDHLGLDQLLREVKKSQSIEAKINKTREAQFLADKNNQRQLLQSALAEFSKQDQLSDQLKMHLEMNEASLSLLETNLKDKSGVLGELFGVARQAAGDLKADFHSSLISAQFPKRIGQLDALANNKALPTISQLEHLWYALQHEMTESGKVVHFTSQVQISGTIQEAKVIRIGTFNALSDGKYLEFLPDTGRYHLLEKQPESRYLSMAEEFSNTTVNTAPVAVGIDPTRGVILGMLIQAPSAVERVKQGGIIGYIILVLGFVGFIYAIYRWVSLFFVGKKMEAQLHLDKAQDDNPLGRVMIAANQDTTVDTDNLELILDEAIIREMPFLEKGLPMIKLLAAVAPLLGLLGTVTGMIATFQSISLFGTGDPKLMASGISQALVTTMLGLCIAIPLLFLHSLVASRSRRLMMVLNEQTAGLICRRLEK